jgi:hypothetical protein
VIVSVRGDVVEAAFPANVKRLFDSPFALGESARAKSERNCHDQKPRQQIPNRHGTSQKLPYDDTLCDKHRSFTLASEYERSLKVVGVKFSISLTTVLWIRLRSACKSIFTAITPREIVWNGILTKLVKQAWEMGETELILIHGHGRNRGITPGFVNTNTGFFWARNQKMFAT